MIEAQQNFIRTEQELNELIAEKNQASTDLENAGFFAFAKKKSLMESISAYDKQIATTQKQTADFQQK